MLNFCRTTRVNGKPLFDDPLVRDGLVTLVLENERSRVLSVRSAWEQAKGGDVTKYASMVKILNSELLHKTSNFVAHARELYGQIRLGSPWAQMDGIWESLWENSLGQPINEGHNDIQHNVIANWGLKLPKE